MFSSALNGYIRVKVPELSSGTLVMDRIFITDWKAEDFSSCKSFNSDGKCLSCSAGQIEYQGECYAKMPGCLIQAGKICVKCELDYIRSEYQCRKECSYFFSEIQVWQRDRPWYTTIINLLKYINIRMNKYREDLLLLFSYYFSFNNYSYVKLIFYRETEITILYTSILDKTGI